MGSSLVSPPFPPLASFERLTIALFGYILRLEGEWIEMKRDFLRRTTLKVSEVIEDDSELKEDGGAQRAKEKGDRVILYVHGGAYFFSSLDTHRYQIQRHGESRFCSLFRVSSRRVVLPSFPLLPLR